MTEIFDIITVGLFASAIRLATPIAFAALGGMFSERGGVINIGLEGMMLTCAFSAVAGTHFFGNPWIGLLIALLVGALQGLLHGLISIKFQGNQIVSGTGINIFALGFTAYMSQVIWGSRGASDAVQGMDPISIPLINDIPIIGEIIGTHTPLVYILIILVIISYIILFKTPFGLRIRAVGEHPAAADTAGVNVFKIKYLCVIISGLFAGFGGAFLSLGHLNLFAWGMTGGRGFIALAAMIFGGWMPFRVLGASLLFGFSDALQLRLQILGILPPQIILTIPYILTIIVLAGIIGKVSPPSDYKPYIRE
jgi:simple sugar transport system permease protein